MSVSQAPLERSTRAKGLESAAHIGKQAARASRGPERIAATALRGPRVTTIILGGNGFECCSECYPTLAHAGFAWPETECGDRAARASRDNATQVTDERLVEVALVQVYLSGLPSIAHALPLPYASSPYLAPLSLSWPPNIPYGVMRIIPTNGTPAPTPICALPIFGTPVPATVAHMESFSLA